jgi:hypothetical protein
MRTTPSRTQMFTWEGGRRGTATLEDMHEAGVPIRAFEGEPKALMLWCAANAVSVIVRPGDVIIESYDGMWQVFAAPGHDADAAPAPPAPDPLPGLVELTLERVGFRRWDEASQAWELRHGGLTVAEMHLGGWQPLYTAHGRHD